MFKKQGDSILHVPSGSNVPGRDEEANPYINYPPADLRRLLTTEKDEGELEKIDSALKQWERIYQWPGYPWKRLSNVLRNIAARMVFAEADPQPQNVPYYMDQEVPEGYEGILESLHGPYDNDNNVRFDYQRQGERPDKDYNNDLGDFSGPKDPVMKDVKPRGDGANPDGFDYEDPPTGGDIESWPDLL